MQTPIEQMKLDRQDLIRSNLRLRDENERLTAVVEELQDRMPTLIMTAQEAEHDRKFWLIISLWVSAVLALIIITLVLIAVFGGWR